MERTATYNVEYNNMLIKFLSLAIALYVQNDNINEIVLSNLPTSLMTVLKHSRQLKIQKFGIVLFANTFPVSIASLSVQFLSLLLLRD